MYALGLVIMQRLAAHGASLRNDSYKIWLDQFPEVVMNYVASDLTSRSM